MILVGCGDDGIHYKEDMFIKDWLLLGPLPNCEDCSDVDYKHTSNCTGFFTDYLVSIGGELSAIPTEGMVVNIKEKNLERKWFFYNSQTDLIPLNDIMDPNDSAFRSSYTIGDRQERSFFGAHILFPTDHSLWFDK